MEYVFSSVQGVAQCLGDLAAINCMYMPYRLSEIYPHILIGKSRRGYVYIMDSGAHHILIGNRPCLVPKNFKILRHIESLDACLEH
jgi:hypothetical protein